MGSDTMLGHGAVLPFDPALISGVQGVSQALSSWGAALFEQNQRRLCPASVSREDGHSGLSHRGLSGPGLYHAPPPGYGGGWAGFHRAGCAL